MTTFEVQETAVIQAPAPTVYQIIADYEVGHQEILPRRYFKRMEVLEGGRGTGTVIRVDLDVYGNKATYTLTVTEPEPGRVIQEQDEEAGITTTFIINPIDERSSEVTIHSINPAKPGVMGWLGQKVTAVVTKRIYRDELAQLDEVAQRATHLDASG